MNTPPNFSERVTGLMLGTAVGDALGLPGEGLSRKRIELRWQGEWRHRFIFGKGMCSDDTEHTFFVAQALFSHPNVPVAFQHCLAWKLRLWLLGLPAVIGLATLRSILKLWLGITPSRSGVFSAGNGPAMRSAILGANFFDDAAKQRQFVSAATRLTHRDPKAETAALAVAEAAAWAIVNRFRHPNGDFFTHFFPSTLNFFVVLIASLLHLPILPSSGLPQDFLFQTHYKHEREPDINGF